MRLVTSRDGVASILAGRAMIVSILAALTLAVMGARLLSPHFGLLDDGVTMYVSRALGHALGAGDPGLILRLELERGRFRPLYWLFEAVQYAIWGPSALGFFIGNGLALLLTALGVAGTVAVVTRDRLASLLAGVAYVLSPPVSEGYYTLSKPEVPLALWLAVSLWGWAGARVESERSPTRSRWLFAVSASSLFMAYFTKETAQAMVLVSALWLVASWATARIAQSSAAARVDRRYFGVNVAWAALFWIARVISGTVAVAAGGDSQRYAVTGLSIVSSGLGHLVWYARDFPLVLPLLAFLAWPRARRTRCDPWLTFVPVLWILSWTLIMLPWPTIFEYYLLPASVAVAVITGMGVASVLRALRAPQTSVRVVAGVLLAFMLLGLTVTLANAVTSARIQLAADGANAKLVDYLAAQSPPGATVLVDLPAPNEYVDELALQLARLRGREDLDVQYRDRRVSSREGPVLVATPHMLNRPLPGVRLAVPEASPTHGSDEAQRRFGPGAVLVYRVTRTVRLLVTPVPAGICAMLEHVQAHADLFCASGGRFFDRRTFRYGWEIYQTHGR